MARKGGASPEKVEWKRDRADGQKVFLNRSCLIMNTELRKVGRTCPPQSGLSPPCCAALDGKEENSMAFQGKQRN